MKSDAEKHRVKQFTGGRCETDPMKEKEISRKPVRAQLWALLEPVVCFGRRLSHLASRKTNNVSCSFDSTCF